MTYEGRSNDDGFLSEGGSVNLLSIFMALQQVHSLQVWTGTAERPRSVKEGLL